MKKDHRLIVALDVESYKKAVRTVNKLSSLIKIFKVGSVLFTHYGPKIIKYIHKKGGKVFLDLKFHDIPNTVANAALQATKLGVYMMNVHAASGNDALVKTQEVVTKEATRLKIFKPILLGVTVLTSLHKEDLEGFGINGSVENTVLKLGKITSKSGFDGVVASSKETRILRKTFGQNFVIVTPGIRPQWSVEKEDQKRITTPKEAIDNGADFIVVGRPILQAKKPLKAVKDILREING